MSLLVELSDQQAIDMIDIVRWLEDNDLERIKGKSANEVLNQFTRADELKYELEKYMSIVPADAKTDIQEFCTAAGGICLFNSLCLVIKKFILNEQVEILIYTPFELAVKLEYWLQDFSRLWRLRNKESELFRIKDMIIRICKVLRKM